MRVVIVNKSDQRGGAAVVSSRLMAALRGIGVDARMLVAEKLGNNSETELAAPALQLKRSFITERLKIFMANGFNRSTLFKIDTAADGVALWRHPWLRDADVVCLNWVNQGLLSLRGVGKIMALGKPVVWTMHDMWNFTGVCHHAGLCTSYLKHCGNCPLLGARASADDLSRKTFERKRELYGRPGAPVFVAVSSWLAGLARRSPLLADADVRVIPNAFQIPAIDCRELTAAKHGSGHLQIVFGAARLDDPIKCLPTLMEATRILADRYPKVAQRLELVTFGGVKVESSLQGCGIRHSHLGPIPVERIAEVYKPARIVVSSSSYETLPGTLVEGQAYGCVPVSFDRGGQSDIVEHLLTGYLARWDDDAQRRAHNLAQGIVWAAEQEDGIIEPLVDNVRCRFSAESVALEYKKMFESLLGSQTL